MPGVHVHGQLDNAAENPILVNDDVIESKLNFHNLLMNMSIIAVNIRLKKDVRNLRFHMWMNNFCLFCIREFFSCIV